MEFQIKGDEGMVTMNKKISTEESIARWDRFADNYAALCDELGGFHKEVFLNPTIFSMIDSLQNRRILEAGCGEGYLSRLFSSAGANVTAVDYSTRMIEIAKERTPSDLAIQYHHGNCENLDFLSDSSFEYIISNMVIQDLADYEGAISEMYRLLVDGGVFIFSILHPCFVTPECGWEKTADGQKLHWNVDNYFYEGCFEQGLGGAEKMVFYHRTLTSYIDTILRTGFTIERIVEPKPTEEMIQKYPMAEEDLRCPDFIVFKLRKSV